VNRIALALVLFLLAAPLQAQEADTPPSPAGKESEPAPVHPIDDALQKCMDNAKSTADMVACEDEAYKRWDEELNRIYGELGKRVDAKQREALKSSQLAWIKFRDQELQWVGALYGGFDGTMYQPMRIDAAKEVVRRRAGELQHYLDLLNEHGAPPEEDSKSVKKGDSKVQKPSK
jgi:uncharacterized protein YecT (DUF1311 family)